MAVEPEIYDSAAVTVNGVLLIDSTNIVVNYMDSDELIPLIGKARPLALSPGGRFMTIELAEHIPVSGFRFNHIQKYIDTEEVVIGVQLLGSGWRLTSTGFMKAPSMEVAIRTNTTFKTQFIGKASRWQA